MATSSFGIFQSDLVIQSAIQAALADIRANDWLIDYVFVGLLQDGLTAARYGQRQVQEAKRWFLKTEVPVFTNTIAPAQLPCITIALVESSEVEREVTLADVHYEPDEVLEGVDFTVAGPFTPTSYDPETGTLGLPAAIAATSLLSTSMDVADSAGSRHPIVDVADDQLSVTVEAGLNLDFRQATLFLRRPAMRTMLESSSFRETFTLGCHVSGPPLYLLVLHHVLAFALLRYKQSLLEARGFERSTFSSSDFAKNQVLDAETTYSRYVTLSGYVRQSWPKDQVPSFAALQVGLTLSQATQSGGVGGAGDLDQDGDDSDDDLDDSANASVELSVLSGDLRAAALSYLKVDGNALVVGNLSAGSVQTNTVRVSQGIYTADLHASNDALVGGRLRLGNFPTSGLPSAALVGALAYDTTGGVIKYSNGYAWQTLGSGTSGDVVAISTDGLTDNTLVIQGALMAAPTGGTVELLAGNHLISVGLTLDQKTSVKLVGAGTLVWQGTTEAAYRAAAYTPATAVPMLWLKGCQHCLVDVGLGCPGGYRVAEGVRMTTQSGGQVSTRNQLGPHFGAGGNLDNIETGVRIGGAFGGVPGAIDANNDFHVIGPNVTIANYGKTGLYLEDTQVFGIQVLSTVCQPFGIQTSATGAMTAGFATLTHNIPFLGLKDVGKVVEVALAGAGGLDLRARILSVIDNNHVLLDTVATTTVGPTATIYYGAQTGIRCRFCSYSALDGGMGAHLSEDYFVGGGQGASVEIVGAVNEGSRRLLSTDGPSGGITKNVVIRNVRWSGDGAKACTFNGSSGATGTDTYAISWVLGGGLSMDQCYLGDSFGSFPIKLLLGLGSAGDATADRWQMTMKDCTIASQYDVGSTFVTNTPNLLGTNRLTTPTVPSGIAFLGEKPRNAGSYVGAAVSGSVSLSFAWGPYVDVIVSGPTTFTFTELPVGRGTSRHLWVTHQGGPHALTFPAGTLSSAFTGTSGAGLKDHYEVFLDLDGTHYVSGQLGYGP